jgi:uncharacterized membrane protein
MQFSSSVLSAGLVWACLVLAVLMLAFALYGLKALRGQAEHVHLLLGAGAALAVLWSVNARVDPGVALHVLGMSTVTLVLGWRLAVLAAALASVAQLALGTTAFPAASAGWLVSAVLPALVTLGVAWWARFKLPRNPFVFIFVCAFFGSALAVLSTWLAGAGLLAASGQPLPSGPGSSLLAFLPLVMFPEAFINGALVSMLIVYRPEWVRLYDEAFYGRA